MSWVNNEAVDLTGVDEVVDDTTPTLGGQLDAANNKIVNLATPTSANDAARKADVDTVADYAIKVDSFVVTDGGAANGSIAFSVSDAAGGSTGTTGHVARIWISESNLGGPTGNAGFTETTDPVLADYQISHSVGMVDLFFDDNTGDIDFYVSPSPATYYVHIAIGGLVYVQSVAVTGSGE